MGDRVSIQFKKGEDKSVVLFSHWGGMEFVETAKEYVSMLKAECKASETPDDLPLGSLDPETVIVDFIRYITKDMERVESTLYLGATSDDGDNSDNGHHIIEL